MTQSLWYLRNAGKVYGPFPSPQIGEALRVGDIAPDWEISLDEVDWLSIADSGQFESELADGGGSVDPDSLVWRDERRKARERWLGGPHEAELPLPHDIEKDARTRLSVAQDHVRTEALLSAERSRRPPLWIFLLVTAALAGLGVSVWLGQDEQRIQAGIGLAAEADCAAPLANGVNWRACDRRGFALPGASARNAMLEKARLDDARLSGADLSYAVLRGASLRNADLSGARLTGADLRGADLGGADLSGADLGNAVLTEARVAGTRLAGARLDRTVWVDGRVCAPDSLGECR